MPELNPDVRSKCDEMARKAKKMPAGVQYAIVKVIPNIANGAFWGFTSFEDVQEHYEDVKTEKEMSFKLLNNNKCLIEIDPRYLLKCLLMLDPNAVPEQLQKSITTGMAKAKTELKHFLVTKGKSPKGFDGTIGIYCLNDTATISYRGVNYPAFRVAGGDALNQLAVFGYQVKVGGKWVNASDILRGDSRLRDAFWKSVDLSPTKTGLFIQIRSTLTPDKIKELEERYKGK